MKLLNLTCKLFALMPFTIDGTAASVRRTYKDCCIFAFACTLQLVCTCISAYSVVKNYTVVSSTILVLLVIGAELYVVLALVTVASDFISGMGNTEKTLRLISLCDTFLASDVRLVNMGENQSVNLMLLIILSIYLLQFSTFLTSFQDWDKKIFSIVWKTQVKTVHVTLLRYADLLLLVKGRVLCINSFLSKVLREDKSVSAKRFSARPATVDRDTVPCTTSQLCSLRRSYQALCELSTHITTSHEKFLLLLLITSSVLVVQLVCLLVKKQDVYGMGSGMAAELLLGLAVHVTSLALVATPAHVTAMAARRTERLACGLLLRPPRGAAGALWEARLLLRQVRSRRPGVSLLGAFVLDLHLFAVILSVVTTYSTALLTLQ